MRLIGKLTVVLLILLAAGAGALYFLGGPQGFLGGINRLGSTAGDWAGRQVLKVLETYVEPTITYDGLAYEAPATVRLTGVTFTAADGTEVVRAGTFTVTLAEVPKTDEPIVIEAIALEDWSLRLLTELDDQGEFAGFRGLLPFVKEDAIDDDGQQNVEESIKLSNVFRIRDVKLVNGSIEYDAGDGSEPMRLRDIDLETEVSEDPNQPGVYAIDLDLDREPVLAMGIAGDLDIDAFTLNLRTFDLEADVSSAEALESLPPQIQSIFRAYDARGNLRATAAGTARLTAPLESTLDGSLMLDTFNIAQGEYRFPIDTLNTGYTLSSGILRAGATTIDLLEGRVLLNETTIDVADPNMPLSLRWAASNLVLQDLLRQQPNAGDLPKLAGTLNAEGTLSASLADAMNSLGGQGTAQVRKGRLLAIPVITDLLAAMDVLGAISGDQGLQDSVDAEFQLEGDTIRLDSFVFQNPVAAVRGDGTISTEGQLDLSVNAGPLEKVTEGTGIIGDVLGAVTDSLVKYRVKGTLEEPQVSVAPLGIGG